MLRRVFEIFINASNQFIQNERDLILSGVSERCLCGSFMIILRNILNNTEFRDYYTDIEYNRNESRVKTIIDDNLKELDITCDLIVHSRGTFVHQDNLLVIEMKRNTHSLLEKLKDKNRLRALTKPINEVTIISDTGFPLNVCGYILGVYYEVNKEKRQVVVEYFIGGEFFKRKVLQF